MTDATTSAKTRLPAATADAAKKVGRAISGRNDEIEKARRLPDDIVEQLVDLGAFRMFVPSRFGGDELSVAAGLSVIEELGYHDGSLGWCATIGATTALLAAYLPENFAEEIYGADPRLVTGGATAPTGVGKRRPDGLEVSGRWAWGSGTQHCDWIVGGVVLEDGSSERPRMLLPFFESSDVRFLDNWFVSGLCGTGSTDYEVEDVFVPEGRWVELGVDRPRVEGTLYAFPIFSLLSLGVCAVGLGICSRAIDEFKILAGSKRYAGSTRTLAERPAVHAQLAQAEAGLGAARAFVAETVEQAWQAASRDVLTEDDRGRLRLAVTFATEQAARGVDLMYGAGGGTSVYRSSPLQRAFRDIHVVTQHQMVALRNYELLGRMSMGLPVDPRML